jgi:hypothetical protein
MGEYAEIQWQSEMRRGSRAPSRSSGPVPRNEVAAHCSVCGKGIRPVAGVVSASMRQHMWDKHKIRTPN